MEIKKEAYDPSSQLNVCLLNDSFPPVIDGVANAVVNYAGIINSKFGEATVVTPDVPGARDYYSFSVVRYPSLDTEKLAGYRAGFPFDPATINLLKTKGFNVIHTHCPVASTMLARVLRDELNIPVIFTYHTKFDVDIANTVPTKPLQEAAKGLLAENISACDEVWVVSEGAGENLRSLGYKGDYIVMPNGVDLPRGKAPESAIRELAEKYAVPSDCPVFLFVGRIMWYKGLKIMLDSLLKLKEAGYSYRMYFVGDGMDRAEVENYAESLGLNNECIFVGAVSDREALKTWYSSADLLLFCSTFDTNGLVIREAAACSLGSLLIKGSCAAEGITDGKTGILAEENADSVSTAILAFGSDKAAFNLLGEAACSEIYISWEDSVANAVRRYSEVRELWASGELQKRRNPLERLRKFAEEWDESFEAVQKRQREAIENAESKALAALAQADRNRIEALERIKEQIKRAGEQMLWR